MRIYYFNKLIYFLFNLGVREGHHRKGTGWRNWQSENSVEWQKWQLVRSRSHNKFGGEGGSGGGAGEGGMGMEGTVILRVTTSSHNSCKRKRKKVNTKVYDKNSRQTWAYTNNGRRFLQLKNCFTQTLSKPVLSFLFFFSAQYVCPFQTESKSFYKYFCVKKVCQALSVLWRRKWRLIINIVFSLLGLA